jgi:hypothetical protein
MERLSTLPGLTSSLWRMLKTEDMNVERDEVPESGWIFCS